MPDKKYVIRRNCDSSEFFISEVRPNGELQIVEIASGTDSIARVFGKMARNICDSNCTGKPGQSSVPLFEVPGNSVACAGCGNDITNDEGDGYCIPCSNARGEPFD